MSIRLSTRNLRSPLIIAVSLLVVGGVVLATVMMVGGSGDDADADPSPKGTSASPSTDALPKGFCDDLSVLTVSATMYSAGVGDLVDPEHDNGTTLEDLDRSAASVADYGATLSPKAPADIEEEVSTVVKTVAEAHEYLKDDKPAEAFHALYDDTAVDALDAVGEYQSPEGECGK